MATRWCLIGSLFLYRSSKALKDNPHLLHGLNVCQGQVTYEAVAHDLGYEFVDPAGLLG